MFTQGHYFILPISFVTSCLFAYRIKRRLLIGGTKVRVTIAAGNYQGYWSEI